MVTPQPFTPPAWTFVRAHEAWYAQACGITTPTITVQHEAHTADGFPDGIVWEIQIKWGSDSRATVEWGEFAGDVLRERPELVKYLQRVVLLNVPPCSVIEVLEGCGFVDDTDTVMPAWIAEVMAGGHTGIDGS